MKDDANLIKITEEQRRRADNQIWNAAGEYGFTPDVRAYDRDGGADVYFNSIFGIARKKYGDSLDRMWDEIRNTRAADLCEQLAWLAIENACYESEKEIRPALNILRKIYAADAVKGKLTALPYPYNEVYMLHYCRICDGIEKNSEENDEEADEKVKYLADKLEPEDSLSGQELAEYILGFLDGQMLLIPNDIPWEKSTHRIHIPFIRKKKKNTLQDPIRPLGAGITEHGKPGEGVYKATGKHYIWDMSADKSDATIASFVKNIFGSPYMSADESDKIERIVCKGDHDECRILLCRGDRYIAEDIEGYAGIMRREAIRQMDENLVFYRENLKQVHTAVKSLSEKWQNALLAYRQDDIIKGDTGALACRRLWRSDCLGDLRVFDKKTAANEFDISVHILIDGSLSQEERQKHVALQAFIIAESLTACRIPVRVSSFSSISGYTVLSMYRDYNETDGNLNIFNFVTAGGNRDGLAVRLAGYMMEHACGRDPVPEAENRILLILSDTKPNDSINIRSGGSMVQYRGPVSVENTAKEVRFLKNKGISVLCVYTGLDEDLPAAKNIFGRDFVRIGSLDNFAQAVGNLILTQIRV